MKFDGVIVFSCIALIVVGVMLGINIEVQESSLEILNGFSTTLSAFATLFAAIVALYGLSIWRNQFVFSERFKVFTELEGIVIDGLELASMYKSIYWDEYAQFNTPTVYDNHEEERSKLYKSMRENISSYSRKVDSAESLLTSNELKTFKFDFNIYENEMYALFQELDTAYQFDGKERRERLKTYQIKFNSFSKNIKSNLRMIRHS